MVDMWRLSNKLGAAAREVIIGICFVEVEPGGL